MKSASFFPAVLILCAVLFQPLQTRAQEESLKTRVAFVPFLTEGEDPRLQVVGARVSEEVELRLSLMTAFSVSTLETINPYRDIAALRSYVEEYRIDNVLFGMIRQARGGTVTLQMSVYDRGMGRVIRSAERKSGTILEIFGVAGDLLDSLVQEFSGMHVGFGTLELENTGEKGDYAVYIDEERVGTNLSRIAKVLNGERFLEIVQNRMFGREILYAGTVVVYEDKTIAVSFQIPYLLGKEESVLNRCEREIAEYGDAQNAREQVLGVYARLIALLSDVSYCWRLETLREDYRQQEVEYRLEVNYRDIEDNLFRPGVWVFDDLEAISPLVDSYRNPDTVRSLLWRNAAYLFAVLRLNAGYAFFDGRWEEGVGYYGQMYRIVTGVPMDDRDWFFKEKEYIDKRWEAYQKKIDRNVVMTEIGIGVKIGSHFKDLIADGEKILTAYNETVPGELIILTDPCGVRLSVNEKDHGQSPIRLQKLEDDQARVRVEEPWFGEEEVTVALSKERTLLFIRSQQEEQIRVRPIEFLGDDRYLLEWDELEGARSYRIQVDVIDSDFSEPIIDKLGVRDNSLLLSEKLEPGALYRFRVQGINKNGVVSRWSYSDPFPAHRSAQEG